MSENQNDNTLEDTQNSEEASDSKTDKTLESSDKKSDEPLGGKGLKALKSEREKVKSIQAELTKAREKIKELEGGEAEAQDISAELMELKAENAKAINTMLKYETAAKLGLDLTLAARLLGETSEELEEDAKKLLETIRTKTKQESKPKPDNSAGKGEESKPRTPQEALNNIYSS